MQEPTEKHVSDVGILDKYNYYYYKARCRCVDANLVQICNTIKRKLTPPKVFLHAVLLRKK
jgi:hypothetical protein